MSGELSTQHSAAHEGAVVLIRDDRVFVDVEGRAPSQMLSGLLAGAMPENLRDLGDGWWRGMAPCSAMLTPKGRMVCDMRVHRVEPGADGTLLLDIPSGGFEAAIAHFTRYLPPRMARVRELVPAPVSASVVGPAAPGLLAEAIGGPGDASPSELAEDEELVLEGGDGGGLRVVRSGELGACGYDIVGSDDVVENVRARLVEAGAVPAGPSLRELLRLERGRPAFGIEMDGETMPAEAGILERCVEASKGCFTGQEVVVRIRDRGHVNRHLRGLILEGPADSVPAPLFAPNDERPVGELRSTAFQPVARVSIGLGYVRRELDPPSLVRVGSPDGPIARVRSLDRDGWRFEKGDPSFYP